MSTDNLDKKHLYKSMLQAILSEDIDAITHIFSIDDKHCMVLSKYDKLFRKAIDRHLYRSIECLTTLMVNNRVLMGTLVYNINIFHKCILVNDIFCFRLIVNSIPEKYKPGALLSIINSNKIPDINLFVLFKDWDISIEIQYQLCIEKRDTAFMRYLLDQYPSFDINVKNGYLLRHAIDYGSIELVLLLLDHGASLKYINHYTIMCIVTCDKYEILQLLRDYGLDLKSIFSEVELSNKSMSILLNCGVEPEKIITTLLDQIDEYQQ